MNIERAKAILTIVVTAIVNIANVYGYAVDAEPIVTGVTSVLSAIMVVYSWWFNQNVTEQAQTAQIYLDKLKLEKKALRAKENGNG